MSNNMIDAIVWVNTFINGHPSDLGSGNYKAMRFKDFGFEDIRFKDHESIEYRFSMYGNEDILFMRGQTAIADDRITLLFAATKAFKMVMVLKIIPYNNQAPYMMTIEGMNYCVDPEPASVEFTLLDDTTMEDFEHDFVIGNLKTRRR